MGEKIDIASKVHNAIKGRSLLVGVEWIIQNDEIVLDFATANYLDKDIELVTEEEINDLIDRVKHIKYEFGEEKMSCTFILNSKNDYAHIVAFKDEYSLLDWETSMLYLIELGLLG